MAGVVEFGLYKSVGGTQLKGLPGWLPDAPVASVIGESAPNSEYVE